MGKTHVLLYLKKVKKAQTFFVKNLELVSPISGQDFNVKNVCNMGKIRVFVIYKSQKKLFFVKNLDLVSPTSEHDFNVKNVCDMGKTRVFIIYKTWSPTKKLFS